MNRHEFSKLFPLGSHLCREPMPEMTELKRDMENLKRKQVMSDREKYKRAALGRLSHFPLKFSQRLGNDL